MSAVRCGVAAFLVDVFGISTNAWCNDLSAARWVMIADVPHGRAAALLQALGTAGVPARAARIRQRSLHAGLGRFRSSVARGESAVGRVGRWRLDRVRGISRVACGGAGDGG
jgi:hypothetical protein